MMSVRSNKLHFLLLILIGCLISCGPELENLPPPLTFEEQLEIDIEIIDKYLEENEIDAIEHSSGIRYVVLTEGTGKFPNEESDVVVKYEGRHFTGSTFDENDEGITFAIPDLIRSWQIALLIMKEGTKMTVYAPSGLCYGKEGSIGISPNTNLIFDIELVDIIE